MKQTVSNPTASRHGDLPLGTTFPSSRDLTVVGQRHSPSSPERRIPEAK